MSLQHKSDIYEKFHSQTSVQKNLIKRNNFTYRLLLKNLSEYIHHGDTLLDIGCGAGTMSFYFADRCKKVVGIDISKRAIEEAKKSTQFMKINNCSFFVSNFPNKRGKDKFDKIICLEVIEHLRDDKKAMKTIYDSLNKKGIAILSTPSKKAPLYRLGLLKSFDTRVGHLRRYNMEELKKLAKNAGFSVVDSREEEGILRNFLFTNNYAGKLLRFVKFFISDIITVVDNVLVKLFGASQLFIVLKK